MKHEYGWMLDQKYQMIYYIIVSKRGHLTL